PRPPPPSSTLFPYTTALPISLLAQAHRQRLQVLRLRLADDLHAPRLDVLVVAGEGQPRLLHARPEDGAIEPVVAGDELESEVFRSEEHTSELQSLRHLVCRLL